METIPGLLVIKLYVSYVFDTYYLLVKTWNQDQWTGLVEKTISYMELIQLNEIKYQRIQNWTKYPSHWYETFIEGRLHSELNVMIIKG